MLVDHKYEIINIIAMPRIEVEKMLNVFLLRKKKGYSQFELSFLMGQRDFYVRDAEDLSHTLIYSVPFNNIFREIFDCDIQAIVPDLTSANYTIQISKVNDHSGNVVYKAEKVFDDCHTELLGMLTAEPKNLLLESQSKISEQAVKDWVLNQISAGYFGEPKNALHILKDCEKKLGSTIRPLFLANALKSCNGTKGAPKLMSKKNGNGRFVFGE
ncbi:hypothetical protein [Sphingobacterium thalpophilum]|uniref:Uncharacterized protein n=1 Tax=Sphingobacterium thalpophilum TaxID=259 RepID=A0A4U9VK36_9SPHI|nr:hypothetical protein [Sphingobacterium thalpophilum]VTR43681.1 Uncharacterised protein [Sphingobacterium thalpophilum]